jgi:ribosomal protein S18 acetylase RimI-like enzyme
MPAELITIRPVSEVPPDDFVSALNAAYADYFVPIRLSRQSFADLVAYESIRLEFSAAAFYRRQIVGMGLLAVRGRRGWIGGMGVLPAFRRRGIARRIMLHLLEQARQLGLSTLQLEVITQNMAAYPLYSSLGFQTVRRLLILTCEKYILDSPPVQPAADLSIERHDPRMLLDRLAELPAPRRPWQRERDSLRTGLERLNGLAAFTGADRRLAGVCLCGRGLGQVGLLDLAAVSPEAAAGLLQGLFQQFCPSRFYYQNVGDDDPLLPVLLAAGFAETLSQYEMFLPLNQEAAI